jgi:hypothetical protein
MVFIEVSDPIGAGFAQNKLPAISPYRFIAAEGGLMSYGIALIDLFRRAAGYVDAFSRARSPPTCRFCRRPNSSW